MLRTGGVYQYSNIMKATYSKSTVHIIMNFEILNDFPLRPEMRQEYQLYSIQCLEVLAGALWEENELKGYK